MYVHKKYAASTASTLLLISAIGCASPKAEPAQSAPVSQASTGPIVHKALLITLEAKPEKSSDLAAFLRGGLPLVEREPGTATWYGYQLGPTTFGVFDAFADDRARDAHLNGKVAATLSAKAGELLAKPPVVEKVDVLAAKLPRGEGKPVKLGLLVPLEAKPGKERDMTAFLEGGKSVVDDETSTIAWFAYSRGGSTFGVFDVFPDGAGRDAHLSGKVAAALGAHATELLSAPPQIVKVDVVAAKLPQ